MCELNRITSHLVWLATSGLELGAVSVMLYGFREREVIMEIFEALTGLRMNHAYIRIGGVVMDLPDDGPQKTPAFCSTLLPGRIDEYETLLHDNPIWRGAERRRRCPHRRAGARARRDRPGSAGDRGRRRPAQGHPVLRLRVTFDFDVPVRSEGDALRARYVVRLAEMRESLRIARQALERIGGDAGSRDDRRPEGGLAVRGCRSARTASATTLAYLRHIMAEGTT